MTAAVAQLAFEQPVDPLDDFAQVGLLLLLHTSAANGVHVGKGIAAADRQIERLRTAIAQGVMGQHHLRKIHCIPLAPELQQRQQPPVEQEALLDFGVAVVEHLRQECIQAHVRTH